MHHCGFGKHRIDICLSRRDSRAGFACGRAEHLQRLSRRTDELNGPHTTVCSRCDSPRTRPRWQRLTLAPARQSVATSHGPQTGIAEDGNREAPSTREGEGIAQARALSGASLSGAGCLGTRRTRRVSEMRARGNPAEPRAKRGVSTGSLSSTTRPRPHCDLTDAPRTPARDPRGRTRLSGFVRLHARARPR